MYEKDIERLITEIVPKVVIPIHTEHPELFSSWARDNRIPLIGEMIKFQ
jgi:mRNA degradation ribonuclease J1/J2